MSYDGTYFNIYIFEFSHCMMRSFALIVENIMSVCYSVARLCEHSNLVRFEKRAGKTM